MRELFAQYGEQLADLEVRRACLEDTYMAIVARQQNAPQQSDRPPSGFEERNR